MDIIANTNTWSNQRRKKRLLKRLDELQTKKTKIDDTKELNEESVMVKDDMFKTTSSDCNSNNMQSTNEINDIQSEENNQKNNCSQKECCLHIPTTLKSVSEVITREPIVHAITKIFKKDNHFVLQVEYLKGTGGKEGVHQIVQYIKNNWK